MRRTKYEYENNLFHISLVGKELLVRQPEAQECCGAAAPHFFLYT
jgi:hypothetical protein